MISYAVRFTRPVVVPDDADGVEVEFSASVSAVDGSLVTVSIEAISDGQRCWAPRERKWISAYACRTVIMKPETQEMRPEPVEGHADGLRQAQPADIRPEAGQGRSYLLTTPRSALGPGTPDAHRQTEPELIEGCATLTPRANQCSFSAAARTC